MIWAYLSSNGGGQYWLSPKLSFTSVDYAKLYYSVLRMYVVLEEFESFPRQELPKDHSNSSPLWFILNTKSEKFFFHLFQIGECQIIFGKLSQMKVIRFQRAWWNYQFFCNFLVQDDPLYRSSSRMRSIRYKL